MDIINLIIGLLLIVLGVGLFFYDNKKDQTGMLKAIQMKLTFTRIGMILIGLYVIYLEINKIA